MYKEVKFMNNVYDLVLLDRENYGFFSKLSDEWFYIMEIRNYDVCLSIFNHEIVVFIVFVL